MTGRNVKNIHGIPILFEKSKRAKNISIRIKHNGDVRVAIPHFSTYKFAEKVALERIDWICHKKNEMEGRTKRIRDKLKDLKAINHTKSKVLLKNRLKELAEIYGFKYNRVFIRNQKTRWVMSPTKSVINKALTDERD